MSRPASDLQAVRMPLGPGPAIDPLALAGPNGMVFRSGPRTRVGLGAALTLGLPGGLEAPRDVAAVTEALAAITVVDHLEGAGTGTAPWSGVLAFGALPFDRSAPAAMVVPQLVYGSDDGREWVTVLGAGAAELPREPTAVRAWLARRSTSPVPGVVPEEETGVERPGPTPAIAPRSSDDSFRAAVAEALRCIGRGDVAKVVLARRVDVTMGRAIAVTELLRRWHALEPDCALFCLPDAEGQFVGASPELLIERSGSLLRSRPLAGTTGRSVADASGASGASLLSSSKDGHEHRLVVEAIDEVLRPLCAELEVPDRPGLVHLHNITHLGTPIEGTLARRHNGTVPSALELVAALHPTPAVAGVPRPAALDLIDRLEPDRRGLFAGPVGYVDARGDGTWVVGIRSMTVRGATAALAAGVGIVEGSDPERELRETELKLASVFDALAPGLAFSTSDSTSGSTSDSRSEPPVGHVAVS